MRSLQYTHCTCTLLATGGAHPARLYCWQWTGTLSALSTAVVDVGERTTRTHCMFKIQIACSEKGYTLHQCTFMTVAAGVILAV
jgi:hypothetical protein